MYKFEISNMNVKDTYAELSLVAKIKDCILVLEKYLSSQSLNDLYSSIAREIQELEQSRKNTSLFFSVKYNYDKKQLEVNHLNAKGDADRLIMVIRRKEVGHVHQ